jgi:putative flavoprotein involved in K+ transport
MTRIDTVVVGAGHAGLAVSNLLSAAGHEHVVLERGRVGERWRSERWDSLHLLTPNWMTRLPGWPYRPLFADRYSSAGEFVGLLDRYAASFDAPVAEATTVEEVSLVAPASDHPYLAVTDRRTWRARHVVVATGPNGVPRWPAAVATEGAGGVEVIAASRYRNPAQLASGGVLVVGASASGVQIADELARAGREVVLAVGRHTRMPRRYRGMDIFWWLQSTGRLARTIDDVPDVAAARREPSLQLVGRNDSELVEQNVDLAALQAIGVRLAGRLERLIGAQARFRDDLADTIAAADRRMHRFLDVAAFAPASSQRSPGGLSPLA